MESDTRQYLITYVGLAAGQRGFIVTVGRSGHDDADLAYYHDSGTTESIDAAYRDASACVESVKRGRYVGSRDGMSVHVHGRTLTVTRDGGLN